MSEFGISTPITALFGVGRSRAEKLERLGIETLSDLIYFFPRAYENRGNVRMLSQASVDTPCSFILTVASAVRSASIRKGLTISKFRAFDNSGSVEIVFFNSPFVKDVFNIGDTFRFFGKPSLSKNKLQLTNPKYEPYVEGIPLSDFVPIYPETEGLSSKQIDKLVRLAINEVLPKITDPLPEDIRIASSLPTLSYSILNAHFPEGEDALTRALSRLAFDEMLYFGIGISLSVSQKHRGEGVRFSPCSLNAITDQLPYELTSSQKQAINDIYRDTVIGDSNGAISPMARIIVGDVGCGKTICALSAAYISAMSKYQTALMVPTEILARQHYDDARLLFDNIGLRVELLLGSTSQKEKKRIYSLVKSGEVDLIIGTHSLISDKLSFANLGLIITDEQHRFGVTQRGILKERARSAHLLVMSATPIPRTLALALYGDLDISRITDMPSGRQRVDTFVVDESYRKRLNDFISRQIQLGGQCYIVCPSIESSEDENPFVLSEGGSGLVPAKSLNLKNAIEYAEELRRKLPSLRIAVLHGRMKAAEKDDIMSSFSHGEIDVLVSTTVIEVGVNVPNACLMIVENAERFGLSQLHQLRGRVGRGRRKSYCVLISDLKSEKSMARLEIMRTTYDGYEIAEKDLYLRGPGDFFSSNSANIFRQSGGFDFKFASMYNNDELFQKAFGTAKAIVAKDPELALPEHFEIKKQLDRYMKINSSSIS